LIEKLGAFLGEIFIEVEGKMKKLFFNMLKLKLF
jgi:hypothetical protein